MFANRPNIYSECNKCEMQCNNLIQVYIKAHCSLPSMTRRVSCNHIMNLTLSSVILFLTATMAVAVPKPAVNDQASHSEGPVGHLLTAHEAPGQAMQSWRRILCGWISLLLEYLRWCYGPRWRLLQLGDELHQRLRMVEECCMKIIYTNCWLIILKPAA